MTVMLDPYAEMERLRRENERLRGELTLYKARSESEQAQKERLLRRYREARSEIEVLHAVQRLSGWVRSMEGRGALRQLLLLVGEREALVKRRIERLEIEMSEWVERDRDGDILIESLLKERDLWQSRYLNQSRSQLGWELMKTGLDKATGLLKRKNAQLDEMEMSLSLLQHRNQHLVATTSQSKKRDFLRKARSRFSSWLPWSRN